MTSPTNVTSCAQCRAEIWTSATACWKCGAQSTPSTVVADPEVGATTSRPVAATTTEHGTTSFAATTMAPGARPPAITQGVEKPVSLASGERVVHQVQFHPRVILKHLAVSVVITNRRMIVQQPHTLFGVIPHGYVEHSARLESISDVSSGDMIESRKIVQGVVAVFGALFAFTSLTQLGGGIGALFGLLLLGVAIYLFVTARKMAVVARSFGGGLIAAPAGRSESTLVDQAKVVLNDVSVGAGSPPHRQ